MEGAVVSDDLAGEKCQTDDDQKKRVETGASDEQTGPETTDLVNLNVCCYDSKLDKTRLFRRIAKNQRYNNCKRKEENKYFVEYFSSFPDSYWTVQSGGLISIGPSDQTFLLCEKTKNTTI